VKAESRFHFFTLSEQHLKVFLIRLSIFYITSKVSFMLYLNVFLHYD